MNIPRLKETFSNQNVGPRDELRLRVLRSIDENPETSQRQLAAQLGVSLGGVNYAIKALIDRGFVKVNSFRKSGSKGSYLYILTPKGVVEKAFLVTVFLARKLEEYEALQAEIENLKA